MTTQQSGYYRFPTIHEDRIVFVSEDDLWEVPAGGGTARRLTSNRGEVSHPRFSPDGKWIAFTGREEGATEIYRMPAAGGPAERLTYLGSNCFAAGWHDGRILFASNYTQPFPRYFCLHAINPETLDIEALPCGMGMHLCYQGKKALLGRYTSGLSRWKRYRGGRIGQIWVDATGSGKFRRLKLQGNLASPMWVENRIFFVSDQDGVGNIFSCRPDGKALRQHTRHRQFYVRDASTDGQSIVYQNGADIYRLELESGQSNCVEFHYPSPCVQLHRKFVSAARYLEDYSLNPDGSGLAVVSRGKVFTFGNWEGPVRQYGMPQGVRYRLARWLPDDKGLVLVSDEGGEDHIEVHPLEGGEKKMFHFDFGRPQSLEVSPKGGKVALTNHRNELIILDMEQAKTTVVDRNEFDVLLGFDWSPDGAWLAYARHVNKHQSAIFLYHVESGKSTAVTEPVLEDRTPVFDPDGRYLYFLSTRIYNPVYSNVDFELSFPRGMRPYLITLRQDLPSPFVPVPKGFGQNKNDKTKNGDEAEAKEAKEKEVKIAIDLDGILSRTIPFPVAEGIYRNLAASKDRVFYILSPVLGARALTWADPTPPAYAKIMAYDLGKLEEGFFAAAVSSFSVCADGSAIVYRKGEKLRVTESRRDLKQELSKEIQPDRKTGWINLDRVKIALDTRAEWQQMFQEAWRLQRDYFWVEDMSAVDWGKVRDRYAPLIGRVGSRSEFSDLLWEMQGELGTSHAYELGGDYRPAPLYRIGLLGAALKFDSAKKAYVIARMPLCDAWSQSVPPPLLRPGVNVREGMLLLSIGGRQLDRATPPYQTLLSQAGEEVQMEVAEADGSGRRTITVKTLASEAALWYRNWVERNRNYVREASGGKVGYLHIPDMGPEGYGEFHRYFLAELDHEGLIVDLRFNSGGHVSPLLLEKLARKRYGYYKSRWMAQVPKPREAPRGPMAAITNESAGSDGDIFSHGFKMLKLGKLIGTRTWGGVIGIWPRNWLADGTLTTQPEFSNWFCDVGYGVENYGTDPDIEVEITPQDYMAGKDPQLDRAIAEVLREIEENPPQEPDLSQGLPKRPLPWK